MYIDRCLARLLTPSERGQLYKAINLHVAITSDTMVTDAKRHRIFTSSFLLALYTPWLSKHDKHDELILCAVVLLVGGG